MTDDATRIAVAVVTYDDRFLIGRRSPGRPLAGFAEFPGGKVNDDESFESAAVRECFEETGLDVRVDRRIVEKHHSYPHGTLHLQFILCSLPVVTKKLPIPRVPFQWIGRHQLRELRFPEANREVIDLLAADYS